MPVARDYAGTQNSTKPHSGALDGEGEKEVNKQV